MKDIPKFESLKEERKFWEKQSPFEALNEKGWKVAEEGAVAVKSVYTASVGEKGASVLLPKDLLFEMDIKIGGRVKAWKEGNRLMVEAI